MFFRAIFIFLVPFFLSVNSWAANIKVKSDHPDQYTVVKGDTLWGIAGKFLHNPAQWREVWQENSQIKDPNLIYPGDVIYFSMVNGQPRLSRNPGGSIPAMMSQPAEVIVSEEEINNQNLFQPRIRETRIEDAIKLIPTESIAPFLTTPRVVTKNELGEAPYVIHILGEHIVGGAGDRIYARAINNSDNLVFTVFRPGQTYIDPDTKEVLGYEAVYIGNSTLQDIGDPATLLITETDREIRMGDRLLTTDEGEVALNYFPEAPHKYISGKIISVLNGVYEIGQYDIVVINKGIKDGLKSGHVLDIFRHRKLAQDPYSKSKNQPIRFPDEFAGTLMIFRPFERVSYALVMHTEGAIHLLDKVATP